MFALSLIDFLIFNLKFVLYFVLYSYGCRKGLPHPPYHCWPFTYVSLSHHLTHTIINCLNAPNKKSNWIYVGQCILVNKIKINSTNKNRINVHFTIIIMNLISKANIKLQIIKKRVTQSLIIARNFKTDLFCGFRVSQNKKNYRWYRFEHKTLNSKKKPVILYEYFLFWCSYITLLYFNISFSISCHVSYYFQFQQLIPVKRAATFSSESAINQKNIVHYLLNPLTAEPCSPAKRNTEMFACAFGYVRDWKNVNQIIFVLGIGHAAFTPIRLQCVRVHLYPAMIALLAKQVSYNSESILLSLSVLYGP